MFIQKLASFSKKCEVIHHSKYCIAGHNFLISHLYRYSTLNELLSHCKVRKKLRENAKHASVIPKLQRNIATVLRILVRFVGIKSCSQLFCTFFH